MTTSLLTDRYELTMLQAYFEEGMTEPATFSLFARKLPKSRNYFVACGLEDVLSYLEVLRFDDEALAYLQSLGITPDAAESLLRRARIGMGANYRGPAVIGYDAANEDAVILGRSAIIANLMLGKRFPLRRGQALDLQLNIENLFNNNDRLPYSAAAPGNVVRYILPRVRQTWSMRATYTF